MHRIGHNLGLGHAFLSGGGGDYSSYMSATGWKPNLEGPAKCFNAASNRQMQWFDDRSKEIDMSSQGARRVKLTAFSEAEGNTGPILIKVGTTYAIQYNFASNFNSGTEMLRNEVTIAQIIEGGGKTEVRYSKGKLYRTIQTFSLLTINFIFDAGPKRGIDA